MKKYELVNPSVVKRSIAVIVLVMFLITSASSLAIGIESLKMVERKTGTAGSDLGWNVTEIGDINGDTSMDYAVGAPGYGSGDGRVYVYYGPITSIALTSAAWTISGNSSQGGGFGWSIAPCNDYDGDGKDDFIVGAPLEDRAYLFKGATQVSSATQANLTLVGVDGSLFGHSVAGLDYEGNGNIVAAVGAPDHDHLIQSIGSDLPTGGVFMYNISKMFQESRKIGNTSNYDFSFMGESSNEKFGFLVKNLGDMDGDGNEDMGIGDPFYDNEKGGLFIQLGKFTMFEYYPYAYPSQMNGWIYGATAAAAGNPGGRLGWSCASAGDYNFDLNFDIFVGAPFDGEGRVYLFSGIGLGALQVDLTLVSPDAEFNGTAQGDRFGWAIGSTPIYQTVDIVTISAPMHDNGTSANAGAIYSFWPVSTSTSSISANDAQAQFFGEAAGDQLGYSLTKAEYRNAGNMKILTSSPFQGAGDQGALYFFERNQAPKLSQLLCTPPSGAGDQEFTITVNYTDEDGDRPEYVKLMVFHGDPRSSGSPLIVEYPLTFSHGLNAMNGLFYNIETTLNNSIIIRGIEVVDENLYFRVRTRAVRGTMYEVFSQDLKGPVVDDIDPSRVRNIALSNDTGVKGTFKASWDWPGEDDFGTLVGDKVSKLHIKIREGEAITEDNWESSDTYYTFSGSGELQNPGFPQYDFTFGTQVETNMFNLQLKPGFSLDYEEHVRYFVAFRGVDDKGNQGPISNPISVEPFWDRPTILSPIETVTLVDVPDDEGGTLNVSWSASPSIDCTEYRIYITREEITTILDNETGEYLESDYRITKADDPETFKNAWLEISSYSGGDLLDGEEYYAAVVAVNWLNKLNPEVKMSSPETVINNEEIDIAQARDVSGEDVIGDSVTLKISWTPSSDDKFTEYRIYGQRYSFSNVDDALLLATITDRTVGALYVTELNDVPLEGGVAYSFAVLVRDYNRHMITVLDDNNTARGVYLIDDISDDIMPQIKGVTLRDAPEDEGGSLVVSWYKLYVKDKFLYYNIYYDDEPIESLTGLTPIKSIYDNLVGDYEFNESTGQKLLDGRDYYVAVSVVNFDFRETLLVDRNNTAGPIEPINQFDITPPMRPGAIGSSARTDNSITITWDSMSWDDVPDFHHYLITYTGKRSGEEEVDGGREVGEFTIKGLIKGSQYWINLAIVDDAGNVGESSDDIEVYTTGENQAPYNIMIKVQAAISEFELWDENNTLEIHELDLGKEVSFTGTALDDYTSYIYLYWQWVITTPSGTVIVKQGYTVETEVKEAGDYIISLRVKDEDGLWSENLTVYMNVEGEEKDPETFKLILLIFLVVIIIVIVIVVFVTIKSGKKSRMKEDMKRYEDRQQEIDAMGKIYTDLPSWTCPCGTTQIPITETANCPSCYESHEGV
ncbi:MAG: fibronectin type III domain-containing protein, partial [Thermoplasmata archaeon]|nr:fibronectin type III domain-containing protein [Thermoplasmata archaeon]